MNLKMIGITILVVAIVLVGFYIFGDWEGKNEERLYGSWSYTYEDEWNEITYTDIITFYRSGDVSIDGEENRISKGLVKWELTSGDFPGENKWYYDITIIHFRYSATGDSAHVRIGNTRWDNYGIDFIDRNNAIIYGMFGRNYNIEKL